MLASKSTHGFLKINDVSTICTPNTTVTGRFANGSFANVSAQFANGSFANVSAQFANV